ncbi:hypothetical protein B0J18DRAFT_100537 [Chaetomium sp. MPI-SDFR-AT-0129]|nr:hypothetical protein B0J18DRAFT_100537 [Chaetomium sp. MPI-SDFR-AT-0129]
MSVHRLGFTELSASQGTRDGPYRVNIIFVHGLGGHPQHTWEDSRSKNRESVNGGNHSEAGTSKRKLFKRLFKSKALPSAPSSTTVSSSISASGSAKDSGLTSTSSSITAWSSTTTPTSVTASVANIETGKEYSKKLFWPREFLTEDIPEARVWTYGYNADAVGGVFQANNKNSVSQHARDFAVRVERDIRNEDPILFVAHSLGGIIVKDYVGRMCAVRALNSSSSWVHLTGEVGLQDGARSHGTWLR